MFVCGKSKDKYYGCISTNIKIRHIHSNRKDKFCENLAGKGWADDIRVPSADHQAGPQIWGGSGVGELTTDQGLRSGAARVPGAQVPGALQAVCVVSSPSLGREDTGEEGFTSALPKSLSEV